MNIVLVYPLLLTFYPRKLLFKYSIGSKIWKTFLLFSNKLLVFRAGTHKVLVRIANREDPDQTAS